MFGNLFGKKMSDAEIEAAETAFSEAKRTALERTLGPMDDTVLHALIPFELGGTLDLYFFSTCIPGTVIVTQELIACDPKRRPKKGKFGHYELVACLPPGKARDDAKALDLINPLLNIVARYAFHAKLNPGETAEVPTSENGPMQPILFGAFEGNGTPFEVMRERFGLLLVMPLHPSELTFARSNGGAALTEKLKLAAAWPYADLSRPAVV